MRRRGIEGTILFSLAVLVVAGLIALALRGKERASLGAGPEPTPP